ncbi:MAG: transporter substrate-binding domain-containing protein [Bradyrhizobium sp.]
MMALSFRAGFAAIVFAFMAGGGALRAQSIDPAAGKELAPTGHLRVGVYAGSPTSQVTDPETKEKHGVTYDLAKEFAARLNVPVEYISFPRIADVIEGIKDGKVDFTVTNATPVRARDVNFSQILLIVELGYLVPANSPISRPSRSTGRASASAFPRAAHRSGCSRKNTRTRKSFPRRAFRTRSIRCVTACSTSTPPTSRSCSRWRSRCPVRGFWMATGARNIWPLPSPKGREASQGLLDSFVRDVQSSGRLQQIETIAGLKGTVSATKD